MQHKQIWTLILTGCLATTVLALEPLSPFLQTGWDNIEQAKLRQDLAYLTDNKREGRLALTQGDNDTVAWLVTEFQKAGLKPGNGNSYLQTFNVIEYVPDTKQCTLELQRDGAKISWKKPNVFTSFKKDINLSGGVVFAGYGITAPALKYDDYEDVDVHGKFVLVFEHEPQETDPNSVFNGTGNTPFATTRVKALNAQQHGAIGILIAPEPNRKHPSNQERYKRIGGNRKDQIPEMVLENDELHIPVVILSDKVANEIAGKMPLSDLQKVIDRDLTPQSQIIPKTNINLQERVKSSRVASTSNVVGILEGTDPELKTETVIISAHHDHDGKSGTQIWHGADDNASGTAGVLAVARAMMANVNANEGLKPKRSILFSVFAAEERGLLGSYYMAKHPLRPLDTTRAMINFDMIGRDEKPSKQTDGLIDIPEDTSNTLNLIGAHFSPEYDDIVRAENQFVGLTLDDRFNSENALNTFFRSDQFPFILHQVPAFWWFTGFHPDYHHTSDTAAKINYAKMQKILRLAYLSAYQFANTAQPPEFVQYPQPL